MEQSREPRNKPCVHGPVSLDKGAKTTQREEGSLSNKRGQGSLDVHTQKNKDGLLPYIIYKINSKWILNVRPPNHHIPRKNIGKNFLTLGLAIISWIWQLNHKQWNKHRQIGLRQTQKRTCSRANNGQNDSVTCSVIANICKPHIEYAQNL